MTDVIAVIIFLLSISYASSTKCVELKHGASALVDCDAQSAKFFAQPLCERAHIATFDRSSCNIAVAFLGSDSEALTDLLQTVCTKPMVAMFPATMISSVAPVLTSMKNQRQFTREELVPQVLSPYLQLDSYPFSTAAIPFEGHQLSSTSNPENPFELLPSKPMLPLRRSVYFPSSLPPGCSASVSNDHVYEFDDDDPTSLNTSFPLTIHCSSANLTSMPAVPSEAVFVHLGHNSITMLPPQCFENLTSMTILWLINNLITIIPPGLFNRTTNLTIL